MKFRYLLGILLFNNVQAMDLAPLDTTLSSMADKLTETTTINFVSTRATPNTVLNDVISVFKTKDASAYSKLSYFVNINMMHCYTGYPVFKNISDGDIAQFMLAGTIIRTFDNSIHKKLIWRAFISLSLAIDNGEPAIRDFLKVDIEEVKLGIREIEKTYPDIYEWNLI